MIAAIRRALAHQPAVGQAGLLFIVAGSCSVVYDSLPNRLGSATSVAVVLDVATAVVGAVLLALPWDRWSPRWLSVLPILALAYVAVDRSLAVIPDETYGIWIVVVFVWVGLWLPPWSAIALAPAAIVSYLVPFWVSGVPSGATIASIAISVPVALIVGETLSRRTDAMRRAAAERQAALDALGRANLTDDLTGLGNRRQANVLLDRLRPDDALAILDLDHFKRINDTFGHQRGDEILHELGAFLVDELRSRDGVARYGGEEFVVVLDDAANGAVAVVERLLANWRTRHPHTTLSAGVARHMGTSWSDTFERADNALYLAKQTGRDRVVAADCVLPARTRVATAGEAAAAVRSSGAPVRSDEDVPPDRAELAS